MNDEAGLNKGLLWCFGEDEQQYLDEHRVRYQFVYALKVWSNMYHFLLKTGVYWRDFGNKKAKYAKLPIIFYLGEWGGMDEELIGRAKLSTVHCDAVSLLRVPVIWLTIDYSLNTEQVHTEATVPPPHRIHYSFTHALVTGCLPRRTTKAIAADLWPLTFGVTPSDLLLIFQTN